MYVCPVTWFDYLHLFKCSNTTVIIINVVVKTYDQKWKDLSKAHIMWKVY